MRHDHRIRYRPPMELQEYKEYKESLPTVLRKSCLSRSSMCAQRTRSRCCAGGGARHVSVPCQLLSCCFTGKHQQGVTIDADASLPHNRHIRSISSGGAELGPQRALTNFRKSMLQPSGNVASK